MGTPEYVKYFYLRKVHEVQQRLQTGDYYDLIMASGLLRHLLLDDSPLAHKANKEHGLKFKFEVSPHYDLNQLEIPGLAPPVFDWESIAPVPGLPTETVKVSGLLSRYCMTIYGHRFTVKDILESCAYARGGVHLGDPSEREQVLFDQDSTVIGDANPTVRAFREIIVVVLKGLQPLTDVLNAEFAAKQQQAQQQQ